MVAQMTIFCFDHCAVAALEISCKLTSEIKPAGVRSLRMSPDSSKVVKEI